MNERYDLVFRGDILLDQSLDQVKQRLQKLFKTDAKQVERLFSGRPVVLKRGLEAGAAQKYLRILEQAGARARLVLSAAAAAEPKQPGAAAQSGVSGQGMSDQPSSRPQTTQASYPSSPGLSLAPAQELLLKPGERPSQPPVVVNIDGLSLRPVGGDLLDPAERPSPQASGQPVPEYELSAPGSDLLAPEERHRPAALPAALEVALADWGLAEAGEDLLREQERAQTPPAPLLSGDLSLAPEGTDLEGLPREPAPNPPDTSGLSLAD